MFIIIILFSIIISLGHHVVVAFRNLPVSDELSPKADVFSLIGFVCLVGTGQLVFVHVWQVPIHGHLMVSCFYLLLILDSYR